MVVLTVPGILEARQMYPGFPTTIPMTTIFTPPASCSSSWTYEPYAANHVTGGLLVQNAAASDTADPACFPSGFDQYGRALASNVFSPGWCPDGYTTATMSAEAATTTAVCCLSDFTYVSSTNIDYGNIFAGCTRMFPASSTTSVKIREKDGGSTQISGPVTWWGQPITIHLQPSDLSLFVPSTTSLFSSPTETETAKSSATSTKPISTSTTVAPSMTSASISSGGLSTGAGIGIGVGVGVGGLAIFGAMFLWLWRRRKAQEFAAPVVTMPYREYYKEPPSAESTPSPMVKCQTEPAELDAPHEGLRHLELDN